MLPSMVALIASSPFAGVLGRDVLHRVGLFQFGLALHGVKTSGVVV
jgi:hypothetical protein